MRSAVCGIVRSALSTSPCRTWCSWSRLSHQSHSTVFALSSGKGKCGVAVVRVSGPLSAEAVVQLGGGKHTQLPQPRVATVRKIVDPVSKTTIDKGMVLWIPCPRSFTGEDSAEFHIHGGTAIVVALLEALGRLPGLRHAEPGEFVKRAFFNGKLDLTEVEGLADLINAETELQRVQALRQLEGELSKLYNNWSSDLLRHVAHVEAVIDFGEDENIEVNVLEQVRERVGLLAADIREHLNDGRRGERMRNGIRLAIVGAPNVGKSSLLNILCQRPAAIVSPYAGTTRDVVESSLDLFGYPVVLSDTAGIRSTADPVEEEGIRRAVHRSEVADLRILVADCSQLIQYFSTDISHVSYSELTRQLLHNSSEKLCRDETNTMIVMNKCDLMDQSVPLHSSWSHHDTAQLCWLSCKTMEGMNKFMDMLKNHLKRLGGVTSVAPSLTQARHRHHLTECVSSLDHFIVYSSTEDQLVLAADELRRALTHLGRITGQVVVDDILDVVFSDFCIGK